MASNHEPLLSFPTSKKTILPCKVLLVTLSLAAVIGLISLITIQLSTPNLMNNTLQSADLCTGSPNPSACHAIVSDPLTLSGDPNRTPLHIFNSIVIKSLHQLNSVTDELHRKIHDTNDQSSLADCIHLMDLSRDRLIASATAAASGAHTDSRTWLSAVLTNHGTCLDGLGGPGRSAPESQLQVLMDFASASLAVLNAMDPSSSQHDDVLEPVIDFPSWLSFHDRKLLQDTSSTGIAANAVVAQDGSGKYKKVQDAVNAAPDAGKSRYVIYVKKGFYKENVNIGKKKTNLMIVGDGMDATIISGSLNVIDGSTTFNSATLAAAGDGLILQDLKIENTAGPAKHQAVALRVSADQCAINRCKIEGYQDTLYTHTLRQFYRDSTISGTVDFIFGNAAVVIQNCNIVARKPMPKQQNTITAQGRLDQNQNTGTSIQKCQIAPAKDLIPVEGSIRSYLGRPWKAYSRTVVMQSYIDKHIHPQGWLEWNGNPEFAKTLFYGEYQNSGPGAGTAGRVKWSGFKVITDPKVAMSFTVGVLIQGGSWLKSTGVAFTEGLY